MKTKLLAVLALAAVGSTCWLGCRRPNTEGYAWDDDDQRFALRVTNAVMRINDRVVKSNEGYFVVYLPETMVVTIEAPGYEPCRVTLVPKSNHFDVRLRKLKTP